MPRNIIVEGEDDVAYVRTLLSRIGVEKDAITVRSVGGKRLLAKELQAAASLGNSDTVALVDLDQPSIYDARLEAAKQLGAPQHMVFAAVPSIEAWLFGDVENALSYAGNKVSQSIIQRLPLPEEIPYPKHVAMNVFRAPGTGRYSSENFARILTSMNINVAVSRSPSLRQFVEAFAPSEALEKFKIAPTYARSMTRDALSNLLAEVAPSTATVYQTMDGIKVSSAEMVRAIREGNPRGQQYVSDLLRISRDLLMNISQECQEQNIEDIEPYRFDEE